MMLPYVSAFLAVTCYAALGPIIKRLGVDIPAFLFIAIAGAFLCVGGFLAHLLVEGRTGFLLPSVKQLIGFTVFTVVNIIGWWLYLYSIRQIPVAQYDMIAGGGILITAFFAALFVNEPIHVRYIPAAIFIMIGIYVAIGPDLFGS
jgi:drug/metabolite transporter (DMT)-like permease